MIVESRLGVPLEDSLEGVAERMESKDFEWVVMAIRIQRQVGGNLAELLLRWPRRCASGSTCAARCSRSAPRAGCPARSSAGCRPVFLRYLTLTKPDYVTRCTPRRSAG